MPSQVLKILFVPTIQRINFGLLRFPLRQFFSWLTAHSNFVFFVLYQIPLVPFQTELLGAKYESLQHQAESSAMHINMLW